MIHSYVESETHYPWVAAAYCGVCRTAAAALAFIIQVRPPAECDVHRYSMQSKAELQADMSQLKGDLNDICERCHR